jgi:hypothetical protein
MDRVVIQLITSNVSYLSLGFATAGRRRPFSDVCLHTSLRTFVILYSSWLSSP